jgi:hypothetical protein
MEADTFSIFINLYFRINRTRGLRIILLILIKLENNYIQFINYFIYKKIPSVI